MITKLKEKSLAVLTKEADSVFSEYVRIRDAKAFSGLVHCFICRIPVPWKASHAMHYVDRDQMALRYDEVNVNGWLQGKKNQVSALFYNTENHREFEVIGNIYENPELLNETVERETKR